MAAGNAGHWGRVESVLRSSLRLLRDRWAQGPGQRGGQALAAATERSSSGIQEAGEEVCALQALPIDVQLYIMSFLSPQDLCHLGSTNQYWSLTVRDPLLWRYFLLRDLPSWSSVDWKSLPDMEIFNKSFSELNDNALYDYMTIYKKSCPPSRHLKSSRPTYGALTTFLVQSLITQAEPRFALFGPGLEELDESLVRRMMTCPEILPVAGLPQRQIHEHDRQDEFAHISAMIDPTLGPPNRPVLVLSCTSEVGIKRIPCVYMAHQLQLNLLSQPWMVQDTVAATLSGLLNGIEWILGEVECKNAQ